MKAVMLDAATIACELVVPSCVTEWQTFQTTTADEVANRIRDCAIVITNKVRIGEAELAAAPNLKLIVVAATGYDIINLEACRQHGVAVANSPGYSASSVPEHALALMFAVARSLVPLANSVPKGTWSKAEIFCIHDYPIIELAGKTVGIIGSGSLGRATAKLCSAVGMNVIYCQSKTKAVDDLPRVPFDELLSRADIISLHCPLDADNANLINADTIAQMKDSAILINTARGGLVDSAALVAAIESGKLAGAGIDVLASEPPSPEHPLVKCTHPGLVVTPHVAWASLEVQHRLAKMIATTTDAFFAGNPEHIVT